MEDAGREDVATGHGQRAGSHIGRGLFNNAGHIDHTVFDHAAAHDAVALGVLARHVLHRQNAAAPVRKLLDHLLHDRRAAHHQVVGQQHGKGLTRDQFLGAQHRMAQAQRAGLAHIGAQHVVGRNATRHLKQGGLARHLQLGLQLIGRVEMVFHAALGAAGDENHLANAGRIGLFHRVLDEWLVHHRQHLLGTGLGGGQKAGAQARDGKDGFANGLRFHNGSVRNGSPGSGLSMAFVDPRQPKNLPCPTVRAGA